MLDRKDNESKSHILTFILKAWPDLTWNTGGLLLYQGTLITFNVLFNKVPTSSQLWTNVEEYTKLFVASEWNQ